MRVKNEVHIAHADSVLHVGDLLLAVGPAEKLAQLQVVVGSKSEVDLLQTPGSVTYRQLVVTRDGGSWQITAGARFSAAVRRNGDTRDPSRCRDDRST